MGRPDFKIARERSPLCRRVPQRPILSGLSALDVRSRLTPLGPVPACLGPRLGANAQMLIPLDPILIPLDPLTDDVIVAVGRFV